MDFYERFVLKGEVCFSLDEKTVQTFHRGHVVCDKGKCLGVFRELPEKYADFPVIDYEDRLILPGMTDLHVHAPQYTFRGLGLDLELLQWLNIHTFPEEEKYADPEYAKQAYSYFVEDLKESFTTRAVVFATIHKDSTIVLMDQLEKSGIVTYVGRVNMDRNSTQLLQEEGAEESLRCTREWLDAVEGRFRNTYPILTPRFIPSCSDELMLGLSSLAGERGLCMQSHLSENRDEVEWVRELVPGAKGYGNAYEGFGTLGSAERPTIMAHCVYSGPDEISILKKYGTYVAHCPDSNMNLSSGIAPVRKFLEAGLKVGLGTDMAAGSSLSLLKTMLCAIQSSKMYECLIDASATALTFEEVFYLATVGGGQFFGKAGTFREGYEFDALVIDDSRIRSTRTLTIRERVERLVYQDLDCRLCEKFVRGNRVFCHTQGKETV